VAEIATGAIGTVAAILLSTLGTYRAMNQDEINAAQLVYGDTFDYSRIFFSQENLSNVVLFGIIDWANNDPDSRAFVTNTLVNFDVSDGTWDNATMIHELCHVWQFEEFGPFYMAEAIHAQEWGDGYNYGYTNAGNGNNGGNDLVDAITNNPGLSTAEVFELFNREQQGQIIMHYYVRRHEESLDFAAWLPFRNVVHS